MCFIVPFVFLGITTEYIVVDLFQATKPLMGSVFFSWNQGFIQKRELHHVRVGNLSGGRRRAEASRRHFAHMLVFVLA